MQGRPLRPRRPCCSGMQAALPEASVGRPEFLAERFQVGIAGWLTAPSPVQPLVRRQQGGRPTQEAWFWHKPTAQLIRSLGTAAEKGGRASKLECGGTTLWPSFPAMSQQGMDQLVHFVHSTAIPAGPPPRPYGFARRGVTQRPPDVVGVPTPASPAGSLVTDSAVRWQADRP